MAVHSQYALNWLPHRRAVQPRPHLFAGRDREVMLAGVFAQERPIGAGGDGRIQDLLRPRLGLDVAGNHHHRLAFLLETTDEFLFVRRTLVELQRNTCAE